MVALLCIDTQSGMATRYVPSLIKGARETGTVQILNYHPCAAIAESTIEQLEEYRKQGEV